MNQQSPTYATKFTQREGVDHMAGIHHGTRQGDTESPKYGDLSAVWGEMGPRGKPYFGTLWGNGMSMCMLLSRDCARRGSSYSTIPYTAARRGD